MAQIRVHNITDRPNVDTPAYAVKIGGMRIRPGKCLEVDDSLLTPKLRKLHGSSIWIGAQLPPKFKATSRSALKALSASVTDPMTIEEVREYLSSLSQDELVDLCDQMSPALSFAKTPPSQMLVIKLARACFADEVTLDPAAWFWLRRWTKSGSAFVERG